MAAGIRLGDARPQGFRGIQPASGVIRTSVDRVVAIELNATLVASGSAAAYVRVRDPATGAYTTDTDDDITVKDTREVGYNGVSGAKGAAIVKFLSDGTRYGELVDLECP
jgi:hypothetical protein